MADPILQVLVSSAHRGEIEPGLTLTVNGTIVTGIVVGREKWFREMAEWADDLAAGSGVLPRTIGEALEEAPHDDDVSPEEFTFIHMKDVRIFTGTVALPHNTAFFWRGRLSQISGWALGTLSPS